MAADGEEQISQCVLVTSRLMQNLQNVFPSFKSIRLMLNSAETGVVHVWTSTPGLDTKASSASAAFVCRRRRRGQRLSSWHHRYPPLRPRVAPTPPLSSLDGVDGGDECSGGHAKNDNSYYAAVASGLGLGYGLSS